MFHWHAGWSSKQSKCAPCAATRIINMYAYKSKWQIICTVLKNLPTTSKSHLSQLAVLIPAWSGSVCGASGSITKAFTQIQRYQPHAQSEPQNKDYGFALLTSCWLGLKWWMRVPEKSQLLTSSVVIFTYSATARGHIYHLSAGAQLDTLPVCVVVTWSRIKRSSGVLLRDLVLITWSIFTSGDPPQPPPPELYTAEVIFAGTQQPCGEKRREASL